MDELSLLVDDAIETEAVAASASPKLPAPDFTGSLEYIDSLASRSAVALSRRDVATITTALSTFDYLSPLLNKQAVPGPTERSFSVSTDMRPLQDARMFDPERSSRGPVGLVRSSSRVVASPPLNKFPPGWRNPLDPYRDPAEIERSLNESQRRVQRKPFAFRKPDQVVICLKRKMRKAVMHAFGFAGLTGFRKPRRTYWSRVVC